MKLVLLRLHRLRLAVDFRLGQLRSYFQAQAKIGASLLHWAMATSLLEMAVCTHTANWGASTWAFISALWIYTAKTERETAAIWKKLYLSLK